jgi:hypothetical protein
VGKNPPGVAEVKIQVYSAITNNHDPARTDDILTFTDHSHLGSPLAAARFYKTHPHILFPEANWTIWVDGNVVLNIEPEQLVEMAHPRSFGVFHHFHRQSVAEEMEAVVSGGFDSASNIAQVTNLYKGGIYGPIEIPQYHTLPNHLAMTMVLVRQNTAPNAARNQTWWSLQCASSFRDQLTFPLCFSPPYWPTIDFTQPNQYFTRTP